MFWENFYRNQKGIDKQITIKILKKRGGYEENLSLCESNI